LTLEPSYTQAFELQSVESEHGSPLAPALHEPELLLEEKLR